MHVEHNFFSVIFHFTLFGLLIYKFVELGKAYLMPFLRQRLQDLEKANIVLLEKRELLQSTLKRVQNSIKQQESSFSTLETKVHVWHQQMKEERVQQEKEAAHIEACMAKKQSLQNKYLTEARNMAAVLDEAEQSARVTLSKQCEGARGKDAFRLFLNNLQTKKS